MPNTPGADARQSPYASKLTSIEHEGIPLLAAAALDLFDAINQARLVVNPDLAPEQATSTSKLLESLYPLQDAIHGESSLLAAFLSTGEADFDTDTWSHVMPQAIIDRRSFPPRPASPTDLPFVADVKVGPRKTVRCFWNVLPTDDYGHANNVGRQYACDYAQYLKENPFWVGSGQMGRIVQDMHQHEVGTTTHGYAVGFWAFVEQLLYLTVTQNDHYAIAERDAQRYAAILAARETKAEGALA